MKKRGAIGLQFNWIFVLIVGGLILAFFVTILQSQMKTSELETQVTVQSRLDSLMQNAILSPGSLFEVTVKDVDIKIDDCNAGFYMNDNRNLRLGLETAFSPDHIVSDRDEVVMWTLPWSMPFRITNLMYVTNKDILYVLVEDSDGYADDIFDNPRDISLPDEITKEKAADVAAVNSLMDKNNYKVRLVFFRGTYNVNLPGFFSDVGVTAVQIIPSDGGVNGWGKIIFLEKDPSDSTKLIETGESFYLGRASLIAAIFAENVQLYDCAMDKAYDRMELMLGVYYNRTYSLDSYFRQEYPTGGCYTSGIYNTGSSALEDMSDYLDNYRFATSLIDRETAMSNLYQRATATDGIYGQNQLAQLKSCPTIY
jgi:hypothetical protein